MAQGSSSTAASSLLLDELFEAADPRFLDEILARTTGRALRPLAERWVDDGRSFARQTLLQYIDDGCDRPSHRPLVKALFKLIESRGDDEAMGHFLVAFDRLGKRRPLRTTSWDAQTRAEIPVVIMRPDPSVPERVGNRDTRAPRFSRRTRRYLVRRAFRYFRGVAREDPARYGRAMRRALALYEDRHLEKPEQLLDAWGLLHALYWSSPVLDRDPRGIRVAPGRSLAELEPCPFLPEAWTGCLDALLELLENARSRPVRSFTLALLRRDYATDLRSIALPTIRGLLRSPHDEVQTFAAELLRSARGLETLTLAEWLSLLRIDNPIALPLICELVLEHVTPARLHLAECIELATAGAAPVAELGLRWAREKSVADEASIRTVLALALAETSIVRREGTDWVLALLSEAKAARPEHLRELLDARHADVRERALALFDRSPRFRENTLLWAALSESPHDDVRAFLARHLKEREGSYAPDTLRHLWVTLLLAVHRGGRAKRAALHQVADRVARRPDEAAALLPLLRIALRSVRAAERRAALAAVTRAAFQEESLRAAIARELPELSLPGGEAA